MSGPSVETSRLGLAFVLICQQPEGRNERDPKARGDPGCGRQTARNDLPNQRNWEATCATTFELYWQLRYPFG
jgi:hypothetical protein